MAGGAGGGEHRVRIRADGAGEAAVMAVAPPPEAGLNRFVRSVALIERLGNALGTLAFTWATVVLLGGYSKELHLESDYWYATVIVFLEATRMFTRDNRLDYQVFFNTRGAFRFVGWNGLVAALCFFHVLLFLLKEGLFSWRILLMAIILATGRFLSGLILHIWHPLHRATSLWSPLVAILPMAPPLSERISRYIDGSYNYYQIRVEYHRIVLPTIRAWVVFAALFVPLLLVTISSLRFTKIVKLVDATLGSKQVIWRGVTLNLCMILALGMQLYMLRLEPFVGPLSKIIVPTCALAVVSFANVQIPAAALRIMLALLSFWPDYGDDLKNLVASLRIFYGMVLGQGMLYVLAGMIEFFSFIPRRSLVHSGGFRGQWGVESVNLYYAYALEECMQDAVLAPKKISLSTFAVDSLSSDLLKKKLNGIRMMHSILQREPTKAQLLSELNTCAKTMATIVRMLDWKSPADASIRLYAAKVTAQLANNLRLVTLPGAMQLVSALLDTSTESRLAKRGNPLLVTDDDEQEEDPSLSTPDHNQEREHVADNQGLRRDPLEDDPTDNLLETPTRSTQQACIGKQKHYILRCWQWILELRSIPKEQPSTDHDLLPVLAMSIIERLAYCDHENCVELSNAANLVPKIIGFTRYRQDTNTANTEAQQNILLKSSLKVLQRLTSIDGEIGIALRHKISKHPFLFRNLAEILGDNRNSQESRKLVAGILRNLAVDGNTRQEDIGRTQLTITGLMQAYLSAEGTISTNADHSLRKVAGQALAMLTTESVNNCMVLLKQPEFIRKLKTMILIHDDKYIYVAASLLRNLCLHARTELRDLDLKELSHTLREVLERIIDVEGAELEILIGLSSQICKIIPEDFTRELDDGQIKRRFVKRLIDVLNANTNTEPSPHCPGIRRVILEQVINMAECNYRHTYAECFKEFRMTEALSVVEETLSEAENYRLFLGDAGFMEYSVPISALLARAKELVGH